MTSLDFGPLVLGGNTFGWTSDKDESFAVLDSFVDAGGRSIDTADAYSAWVPGNSGGESETIIGEWLASRAKSDSAIREKVVIGTKVFSLATRPGLGSANIHAAVDDSLRRLQTDYIDLYYAHRDDDTVEQSEYVAAFDDLVKAGKVREVGASNFSIDRLTSALDIAESGGLTPFTVVQDKLNVIDRGIEKDLPKLVDLGVVELPYAALEGGFLTGKYREGADVQSARAGNASKHLANPKSVALIDTLDQIAHEHQVSVTAVALAWLRQQTAVGAPIASARTVEQLPDLVESFSLTLTEGELAQLD